MLTTSPCSRICPASGRTRPISIFISVDLPAPFSPRMPWMRPLCSARLTWSQATTRPKRLEMSMNSAAGGESSSPPAR